MARRKRSAGFDYIPVEEHNRLMSELRMKPFYDAAARRLADSLLLVLSQKPRAEWPDWAKRTLEWEAEKLPLLRNMYK